MYRKLKADPFPCIGFLGQPENWSFFSNDHNSPDIELVVERACEHHPNKVGHEEREEEQLGRVRNIKVLQHRRASSLYRKHCCGFVLVPCGSRTRSSSVPLTSACSTCQREKVQAVVNPQLIPMHKHCNTLYGTIPTISKPY